MEKKLLRAAFTLLSLFLAYASLADACALPLSAACLAPCVIASLLSIADSKRARGIASATLICICAAVTAVKHRLVIGGAELVANRVFAASEHCQNYYYEKFDISIPEASQTTAVALALVLGTALVGALLVLLPRAGTAALAVACAGVQIYFGIAPIWWLDVMLFVCLASLLACSGEVVNPQSLAIMLSLVVVVTAGVHFAFPDVQSTAVSGINEQVRDFLDNGADSMYQRLPEDVKPQSSDNTPSAKTDKGEGAALEKGNKNGRGGSKKHAANAKTVAHSLARLLALVLLALLIIAAVVALIIRKARLRRDAVRYAFSQTLRLLHIMGLKKRNVPLSDRYDEITALLGKEYTEAFRTAYAAYNEYSYSGRPPEVGQKETVLSLYRLTRSRLLGNRSRA